MLLIASAKYSSADFTLEFGKIVPSFLPPGDKRLYEYQAKLSKEKVVLSLPNNFKVNRCDLEKLEKLNIRLIFVEPNSSLGESILYCINALNIDGNLSILYGDTFLSNLDLKEDGLCVSAVRENYEWAYLDKEFNIVNEGGRGGKILTGAFYFSDARTLARHLVANHCDFVKSVKSYSKEKIMLATENETWLDFGLMTNYFHSKEIVSTRRSFNEMQISQNHIIKNFSWTEKTKAKKAWFENLPSTLLIYTPKHFTQKSGHALEYLYYNTLSEPFIFGSLPDSIWRKVFLSVKDFSNICDTFKSEDRPNFNYQEKILSKFKEFVKQRSIDPDKSFILNHTPQPSLNELVKQTSEFLPSIKEFSLIHGDFCFSNIMYDFRGSLIKTHDPRGLDFDGKISIFGDKSYDLAKLTHSVLGLCDFIIAGFYECELRDYNLSFKLEINENIIAIQNAFKEVFKIGKALMTLTLHLFLSMLPLHNDDAERQNAFLANAYRIYDLLKEER